MNEALTKLFEDARIALHTIEHNPSMTFKKSAAEWLQSIAKEITNEIETNPVNPTKP